jgi:methionyl-tRNA formyltransferase
VRLLVAGTPEVCVVALDALSGSRHEVAAVLTRPDAPVGRGRALRASPVAHWAEVRGIPVLRPVRPGDPAFLEQLRALAPDCCAVVAYGALIPPVALKIPPHGWVNLHFSLLPAWRGAAPVQRAILAGDQVTGVSTFALEEGLDTGPVYQQRSERVRDTDTAGTLLMRLAASGADLLVATMDGIEDGTLTPRPQPEDGVSLAPKLDVAEAEVDWSAPALRIDRLARACSPDPGAWTWWRGERLKVGPLSLPEDASAATDATPLPAGQLVVTPAAVLVGTATVPLRLGEVQPQGKRMMPAVDWARGARPGPDEGLGR